MEAVYILFRQDGSQDGLVVNLLWQRQLNQNSVDAGIFIQALYQIEQLLLGGLLRHGDDLRKDADLAAGFVFVADIHLRSAVISH